MPELLKNVWVRVVLATVLGGGLVLGAVGYVLLTASGMSWLTQQVLPHFGVAIAQSRGSLADEFRAERITIQTDAARVKISSVVWRGVWEALWSGELQIDELSVGAVEVNTVPQPKTDSSPPQSLRLPLALHIESLKIQALTVNAAPIFEDFSMRIHSDGEQHQLSALSLRTAMGRIHGQLQLAGTWPFALNGELHAQGDVAQQAIDAVATAQGDLGQQLQLHVNAHGQKTAFHAVFDVVVAPFAATVFEQLRSARGQITALNPADFVASAPSALLDFSLDTAASTPGLGGAWFLRNQQPAAWEQGLPLHIAAGQFVLTDEGLDIANTRVELVSGTVYAAGRMTSEQLEATVSADSIDLQALSAALPHTHIQGDLVISGTPTTPKLTLGLRDGARTLSGIMHAKQADTGEWSGIHVKALRWHDGPTQAELNGLMELDEPKSVSATLQFKHLNPQRYRTEWPRGDLQAEAQIEAILGDVLHATWRMSLAEGQLNGESVHGYAHGEWRDQRLKALEVNVVLGRNQFRATGNLGAQNDHLRVVVNAPNLRGLGGVFDGAAQLNADISGALSRPAVKFDVSAQAVRLPAQISVQRAQGHGMLSVTEESPFEVNLTLSGLRVGEHHISELALYGNGTRNQHVAVLQSRGEVMAQAFTLDAALQGKLNDELHWRGQLLRLNHVAGRYSLALRAPVDVELASNVAELSPSRWFVSGSEVDIARVAWRNQHLETVGRWRGLALEPWLSLIPDRSLHGDLVLNGEWALSGALSQLHGDVRIQRERGDVHYDTGRVLSKRLTLGLQQAALQVALKGGRVAVSSQIQGTNVGRLVFAAQWPLNVAVSHAALSGSVQADIPNLALFSKTFAPDVPFDGRVQTQLTLSGTMAQPLLHGRVTGERLQAHIPIQGVYLERGQLSAQFHGNRLQLERLVFHSGDGHIAFDGGVTWNAQQQFAGELAVQFERWLAVKHPDREVVVSGRGHAQMLPNGEFSVTGNVNVDRGQLRLPPDDAPKLSDDVVVIGGVHQVNAAPLPPRPKPRVPLLLNIEVNLGDKLQFSGMGLDATLGGGVRVRATEDIPLALSGAVRVTQGTYRAYGQNLTIERGVITFQGPPDNPGLDILAVRRNTQVMAGVSVTGTALAPRARLVSDPNMPDAQKLSWLILGRGSFDGGKAADMSVLLAAGQSLLSDRDATSLQQRIATTFGLDDLAIREVNVAGVGGDSSTQQILSLGKRLGEQLLLTYEQGLDGNTQVLVLTYQLTKHLSVVSRAGTDTAFDIFYTLQFDKPPQRTSAIVSP